jgi:hypothetical protein
MTLMYLYREWNLPGSTRSVEESGFCCAGILGDGGTASFARAVYHTRHEGELIDGSLINQSSLATLGVNSNFNEIRTLHSLPRGNPRVWHVLQDRIKT